jgi:hypothetical protein
MSAFGMQLLHLLQVDSREEFQVDPKQNHSESVQEHFLRFSMQQD